MIKIFRRLPVVHRQKIEESGLFDADWYTPSFPGRLRLAIFWSITSKTAQGSDTRQAVSSTPLGISRPIRMLRQPAANPLLHYVMWGREEGRQARRSTGPDPIYELRRELSSLRERHETEIGRLRFQDELLNRLENELTSLSRQE